MQIRHHLRKGSIGTMSLGKTIRMKRLIEPQFGSCIVCALDHGMTSPTFLEGLYDTGARTREAIAGGANVFMLGRGIARRVAAEFTPMTSLALMLSASAAGRPEGSVVTPIGSVEEALRLGADAVVVYVALAGENEAEMIQYTSQIGETCESLGMPFIAEADSTYGAKYLLRNARLCAELGADIVKVNWSGDQSSFEKIVRAANVPVVVAGGTLVSDEELLTRMQQAVAVGAIGFSVGRNIFQHRNPTAITRALCRVIREKWSARNAMAELEGEGEV